MRIVQPGEDKLVTLFKSVPDLDDNYTGIVNRIDNTRSAVRVKPAHAPCGDGFDVIVDFGVPHAVYRVTNNPEFNGYQPRRRAASDLRRPPASSSAAPVAGNETNVPLVATRMGASEEVGKQAAAKDILLPESDGEL